MATIYRIPPLCGPKLTQGVLVVGAHSPDGLTGNSTAGEGVLPPEFEPPRIVASEQGWVAAALDVSVIIPSCDRAPTMVARAINSVRTQSRQPKEIIVVNDGSIDLSTCEHIGSAPPGVRIIKTSGHRGASAARNLGVCHASGSYLAFLDDDDWWCPNFLHRTVMVAERIRANFVAASFWDVRGNGREVPGPLAPSELDLAQLTMRNPGITGTNFLICRTLFDEIGGWDERLQVSNDRDLAIRVAKAGAKYVGLSERLVVRNMHSGLRLTSVARRTIVGRARFLKKHRAITPPAVLRRRRAALLLLIHVYRRARRQRAFAYLLGALRAAPIDTLRKLRSGCY